jgi:hypothetical protein
MVLACFLVTALFHGRNLRQPSHFVIVFISEVLKVLVQNLNLHARVLGVLNIADARGFLNIIRAYVITIFA